jgi:hypothetical protein
MSTFEPCTTWAYRLQHLSANLRPRPSGGRSGSILCGASQGFDQEAMDADRRRWSGTVAKKRVSDMPPCTKCAKKAERYSKGGQS